MTAVPDDVRDDEPEPLPCPECDGWLTHTGWCSRPCDCPPSWRHLPDCPQVRDDEDDDA